MIGEALAEVERIAWHLAWDGARWRFMTEPNANKIIAEEMRNVPNSKVNAELEDLIARTFPTDGPVKSILAPSGPAAIPDEPTLRLAVLHHDDISVPASEASTPPHKLVDMLDHAGMGGGIRTYRNAVVFLVADEDAKDAMRDRVRASLAISSLVDEPARMAAFADEVKKKLKGAHGTVKLEARVAINRCFRHLYFPWADKSSDYLRHVELPPTQQGEAEKPQTRVVVEALRNESKIRETPISTDYLRSKAWPKDAAEISTKAVADYFWRDHGAQLVLDPTLIRDAIRDGVKNGSWVYYDVQSQRAWTAKDPPPPVTISSEFALYTLSEATAEGILGRELVWEDIDHILTGDAMVAVELRSKLEVAIGREPSKSEIAVVLARAAEGGLQARVIVVEGPAAPDAKPLSPAEIPDASFDGLTLVAMARGIELGLVIAEMGRPRPIEARGVAGVAFQQLFDRLSDIPGSKGVSRLTISASVEPGEGVRDISLLGKAIGMLPKLDITVDLEMPLEFAGLRHGVEVRLAGPAADYQRVEDAVMALARGASAVAGRLELSIHFTEPVTPGAPELERIRNVVNDLQPGDLHLRADLV